MEAEENINTISVIFEAEANEALDKHAPIKEKKRPL